MATAVQLPPARAVFYDANGNPLAGGFVYTYVPNTTTPKTTWQDSGETTPNANPITLDSAGSCLLYGDGIYQLTVTDSLGNSIPAYSGVTTSPLVGSSTATLAGLMRDYLAGLTLSNDAGAPNTVLDVSAGTCTDSTNTTPITLSAFTKSVASGWVAGSGNGGMGTGVTFSSSTGINGGPWFATFPVIVNGTADFYIDNSITAANAPSGTTAFRRNGFIKADGSAHILPFVQMGDLFEWNNGSPALDVNATNPGTSAVTATANVPVGVNVVAIMNATLQVNSIAAAGSAAYVSDLATPDFAPAGNVVPLAQLFASLQAANNTVAAQLQIRTNTSGQFRYRLSASDANTAFRSLTTGWIDTRGRFA